MKLTVAKFFGFGTSSSAEKPPERYSSVFAFVYIFNLIVGVGALALPHAFSDAGFLLGTILLVILAFMSYMNATYMVEAMATANAYDRHESRKKQPVVEAQSSTIQKGVRNSTDRAYNRRRSFEDYDRYSPTQRSSVSPTHPPGEKTPLVPPIISEGRKGDDARGNAMAVADSQDSDSGGGESEESSKLPFVSTSLPPHDYEIDTKFEMGKMANMFYHPIGIVLYYIAICLYLYGDLTIYLVAIPKSLVVVACTRPPNDINGSDPDIGKFVKNASCFGDGNNLTQIKAYYIFLAATCLFLCPWTFFGITKSKYIQLFTTILRNIAFVLMIIIAIIKLAEGKRGDPTLASISGFPSLFGVSIYSFMCQHSLPGMITPMRSKKNIYPLVLVDFVLILAFYLLLAYTGAFLFPLEALNDLYTLNFFTQFSRSFPIGDQILAVLGYYLALFPVFTLSTNFPIISITLKENLRDLALQLLKVCRRGDTQFHWAITRFLFPVLALVPPIALAFVVQDLTVLVSITGSFPGIAVQYVVPVTLAFAGKYIVTRRLNMKYENKYKSPFSFPVFLIIVLAWTGVSVLLILTEDVINIVHGTFLS